MILVKYASYYRFYDGFSKGKRYKPANTAKIADMVKTATACFRYISCCFKLKF